MSADDQGMMLEEDKSVYHLRSRIASWYWCMV